jgi:hypothetical protein
VDADQGIELARLILRMPLKVGRKLHWEPITYCDPGRIDSRQMDGSMPPSPSVTVISGFGILPKNEARKQGTLNQRMGDQNCLSVDEVLKSHDVGCNLLFPFLIRSSHERKRILAANKAKAIVFDSPVIDWDETIICRTQLHKIIISHDVQHGKMRLLEFT